MASAEGKAEGSLVAIIADEARLLIFMSSAHMGPSTLC